MNDVPPRGSGEQGKPSEATKGEKDKSTSAHVESKPGEWGDLRQLRRSLKEESQPKENVILTGGRNSTLIEQGSDKSQPSEKRTEIAPSRESSGGNEKPSYEVQRVDNPALGVITVGNPEAFGKLNYREDFDGHSATCSILASQSVLEQFGKKISKAELIAYLEGVRNSKDAPNAGIGIGLCKRILSDRSVPASALYYRDIAQLAQYVEGGRGVIIAVNSGDLWSGSPRCAQAPDGDFNHVVIVTGVDYELGTGKIVGFYINDSINDKFGQLIDTSIVKIAWEDRRGIAIVTDYSYDPREAKVDDEHVKPLLDSERLGKEPQNSDERVKHQGIDLLDKPEDVSIEKPPLFYHSSFDGTIEELKPLVAASETSALVHASPDKATSCAYLAKNNGLTRVSHFGKKGTTCAFFQKDRDACLKNDKGGYLYVLKNDTFYQVRRNEWASKDKVKPIEKIYYPSAFEAMLENGVQVYFINNEIAKQIYNSLDRGMSIIRNLQSENQRRGINVQEF